MNRPIRRHRLDKGLKGWIHNAARKNYWRVAAWYDLDDLIQEGYVCYSRCNQKYPMTLAPEHFMALVKIAFVNEIHDMANARRRQVEELLILDTPEQEMDEFVKKQIKAVAVVDEEQTFLTLLNELPGELKELIQLLLSDTAPAIGWISGGRDSKGRFRAKQRESRNDYFCRLIGVDPTLTNIQDIFRKHFA